MAAAGELNQTSSGVHRAFARSSPVEPHSGTASASKQVLGCWGGVSREVEGQEGLMLWKI